MVILFFNLIRPAVKLELPPIGRRETVMNKAMLKFHFDLDKFSA